MTADVREFTSEGHRLLLASTYSPAEIARLTSVRRQRVSDWRSGRMKPAADDRAKLERAIGVPARAWDMTPTVAAPPMSDPLPPSAMADDDDSADALQGSDLRGLGLDALARIAESMRAVATSAPPLSPLKLKALEAEARAVAVHEALRQKSTDARDEYFASGEFRRDVALLAGAFPDRAEAFRDRLARLGVEIPAIAIVTTASNVEAPSTLEDIDELIAELVVAQDLRTKGEKHLALAHTLGLSLDVHADAIASILLEHDDKLPGFLALLEPVDAAPIRSAIERRMLVHDVRAAPTRENVAELLRRLGHDDVAREIGVVANG